MKTYERRITSTSWPTAATLTAGDIIVGHGRQGAPLTDPLTVTGINTTPGLVFVSLTDPNGAPITLTVMPTYQFHLAPRH